MNAQISLVPNAAVTAGSTTVNHYAFGQCGTNYGNFSGSDTEELYTYTATADVPCASLNLDPATQFTGVFVFENALPTSTADACLTSAYSGVFGNTDPVTANFAMTNGTTYYFVVTSEGEGDVNFDIDLDIPTLGMPFVVMSSPASPIEVADGTTLSFYDTGGPTCDYMEDESYEMTICPDAAAVAANKIVQLEFTEFDINNTCETNTSLRIYKGTSVVPANEIPIDGKYLNQDFTTDVRIFASIIAGGCMTITFDNPAIAGACEGTGWTGNFTVIDNPCTTTTMADECNIAPLLMTGQELLSTSECFTGGLSACGFGYNNNGWFKFIPTATTVNIGYEITGGNACYTGTGGDDDELPNMTTGIQMLLYEGCGAADQICTSTLTTGGIDVANGVYASGTWDITGLTVGQTYYAMFDGYGTDLCNFKVSGDATVALPIDLTAFSVKEQGKSNVLYWTTASEENTASHIIERSEDGRSFKEIGNIIAAGNSIEVINYSFIDDKPKTISYYRLKTVDFDGSKGYSSIVSIERNPKIFDINSISPNPARGEINVLINSNTSREVTMTLTNIIGEKVLNKQIELNQGEQVETLNISHLTQGVYLVSLTSETESITYKIIKE